MREKTRTAFALGRFFFFALDTIANLPLVSSPKPTRQALWMQQINDWLRSIGFPTPPELDGKIRRVSRSGHRGKSAWYVGWSEPYVTVVAGDWRTGEKWSFKDGGRPLTDKERFVAKYRLRQAMAEAERERARARQLVALKADIILRSASMSGSHPYLERKQVLAFGLHFLVGELLVPVRDFEGLTWGYERILTNGKKLFLPQQRVEGCFHRIVGDDRRVFIAEGYATAATVHMATAHTVLCAYHAGNLKEVARQASIHCPKAEVVIVGDDDQWTAGNPGRAKAELAAAACGGKVVFPVFESTGSRPTDFNDLHCQEGIEAVSRLLG